MSKDKTRYFRINLRLSAVLSDKELWQDNNTPANLSVNHVYQLIEDNGGIARVIDPWNLLSAPHVFTVTEE